MTDKRPGAGHFEWAREGRRSGRNPAGAMASASRLTSSSVAQSGTQASACLFLSPRRCTWLEQARKRCHRGHERRAHAEDSHRGHERRAHAADKRAPGLSCTCRRRPGAQMRQGQCTSFFTFVARCARPHSGAGGVRAESADMMSPAKKGLLYKLKGFQRRTKHSLFKVVQRSHTRRSRQAAHMHLCMHEHFHAAPLVELTLLTCCLLPARCKNIIINNNNNNGKR